MDKTTEKLIELKGKLAELYYRKNTELDNEHYISGAIINVETQIFETEKLQKITN